MQKTAIEVRDQFPYLCQENAPIYFDSAATTHKADVVLSAMDDFYRQEYATVHRAIYKSASIATSKYHAARQTVQKFIHASDSSEIIFTRSTTEAINLVARSYVDSALKEGETILVTEIEHHANFLPWQNLARKKGLKLEKIAVDDQGDIDLAALASKWHAGIKFVALAHVSNITGGVHPIEEIITLAHAKGAKVLVDGAQSIAHLPVDVKALDVDFFAFSAHKAYGPTGIGVLYGKKELLEAMPPVEFGGDMVERTCWETVTFQPPPLKFEAGTPMIVEAIGLAAALDFLSNLGWEQIQEHDQRLLSYFLAKAEQEPRFIRLGAPQKQSGIVSFSILGIHPLDVATLFDIHGIALRSGHLCSQIAMQRFGITATARISFGLYNTLAEIDTFFETLQRILTRWPHQHE